MMRLKKIVVCIITAVMLLQTFSDCVPVRAERIEKNDDSQYALLQFAAEQSMELKSTLEREGMPYHIYVPGSTDEEEKLPTAVDLTQDYYVPEPVAQDGGTCASFSTMYYQYSYEANRRLGRKKEEGIAFSPYYEFCYAFAYIEGNYMQAQSRGCITWDEWIYRWIDESKDALYDCKDVTAMRNALGMRIEDYYKYIIDYGEAETGTEDQLNEIKQMLANGYMLVTKTNTDLINDGKKSLQDGVASISNIKG